MRTTPMPNPRIWKNKAFSEPRQVNPLKTNLLSFFSSKNNKKDLAELGIDIELFSMNKPDQTFDPTIFYQVGQVVVVLFPS